MDSSRILVLKLHVVSFLLLNYANNGLSMKCDNNHNIFAINPVDTTVKEGESATFICAVSNVEDTDRIIWHVNPSQYHSVILNSFNESTNNMVSKMTVYNVGRVSQTHQCVLYVVNSDLTMSSCYSSIAHLDIQYFPSSDELECGSNGNNPLQEGESIQIWCNVTMGNPTVELQWMTEEQNVLNQSIKQENDIVTLTQKINVIPALHKKPVTCRITSPVMFPNQQLLCTVGPFVVYHKPKVSVVPAEATIHVIENNSIEMFCQADAFPPITYFYWACFPPHMIDGCHSSNRTIKLMTSTLASAISGNWTNVFVRCTAANVMGNSSSSSQITIENIAQTQNETEVHQMLTPGNGSSQKENDQVLQVTDTASFLSLPDATEVDDNQHILSEASLPTSPKRSIPISPDVSMVHDIILVKADTDDSWPNSKQPHNVYIISVASVVAGILASAGLFAIISVVLYRHFKHVTTQFATQVQCQHEQGSHTLNSLHHEIPLRCEDKNAESSHIYEETSRFLKRSEGKYTVAQTMYNSSILKRCSDISDGSGTSSSYKSSSSLESSQDEGSHSSAIFDTGNNMDELGDLYGNESVIQMQARSSNVKPYEHPKLFDQNCNTFPEPPPLPLLK